MSFQVYFLTDYKLVIDLIISHQAPRKRLPTNTGDSLPLKKSNTECSGKAWRKELDIYVEETHKIQLDQNVIDTIYKHSKGYWIACVKCKEPTDPSYSKALFSFGHETKYRCMECDVMIQNWGKREKNEFSFDD